MCDRAYFLVAALAPRMVERGSGSIINMGSMAGQIGLAGGAAYGATKAAQAALAMAEGRRLEAERELEELMRAAREQDEARHQREEQEAARIQKDARRKRATPSGVPTMLTVEPSKL